MTRLQETGETLSLDEACEMYELEASCHPGAIGVCDGEWRWDIAAHAYRWWKNTEREA